MMRVFSALNEFPESLRGGVLTVGNFDGVHLGHQALIGFARDIAKRESLPLVGMTFEPSPLAVLFPERAPKVITPIEIKIKLMSQLGFDAFVVVTTTPEILNLTAEDFGRQILAGTFGVRHIVEGPTFNFGRGRQGNTATLKSLGQQYGFEAHIVSLRAFNLDDSQGWQHHPIERRQSPPIRKPAANPIAVSSTLTRELITSGQFGAANQALGHYFEIYGQVTHGQGIGRTLGFPTANLQLINSKQIVPGDGVYAGWARLGDDFDQAWHTDQYHPAAITVGRSPTFENSPWQIEAHLLDYPSDGAPIYNKQVLLAPIELIRPQEKFQSRDHLRIAIDRDCKQIREILAYPKT